ncbi:SusC/RagA family TonB-linked outer membrane protein [Sphingobacterium lumbrici]|uniref:SusC/RagA family TonB-linked outer membrane protein n=1 Tax=Sphingobacterium lumbrici TaxID=2559600 RepID=UPI001129B2AF|nr:SusC/RagA family TonB-linked outer membrane protein [Sphingobacterium lumbrici]
MYKIFINVTGMPKRYIRKIGLIMRLTTMLLIATLMQVSASSIAQSVTLSQKNATLEKIFRDIHNQTGYDFIYDKELLDQKKTISIVVRNEPLESVLKKCLENQSLDYLIKDKLIVIREQLKSMKSNEAQTTGKKVDPIIITGKVITEEGTAMEGATVTLKGLNLVTTTDKLGNFKMAIPDNSSRVLIFSYIGYVPQEYEAKTSETLAIVLKKAIKAMDELVVTGYTEQTKQSITGAVSTVSAKDLENMPVTNIYAALQGMVPGLAIRNSNYQPGKGDYNIEIRGKTTGLSLGGNIGVGGYANIGMNNYGVGNSSPLVIVDGIEGSMDLININDIESVTVLKDASAAIYGVKAANGVILVTTKKGMGNGLRLTYNGFGGVQRSENQVKFLPSWQQAVLINEVLENEAGGGGGVVGGGGTSGGLIGVGGGAVGGGLFGDQLAPISQDSIAKYKAGAPGFYNTNWEDLFYLPLSYTQKHNLGISGGDGKTKFIFSLGYAQEDANVKNVSSKNYTSRLNFKTNFSDKFNIGGGFDLKYNPVMEPSGPMSSGVGELRGLISKFSPMVPAAFENGAPGYNWGGINPLAWANSPSFMKNTTWGTNGNLNIVWMPIKGLTLKQTGGFGFGGADRQTYLSELYAYTGGAAGTPLVEIPGLSNYVSKLSGSKSQSLGLQMATTASYDKYFGNHKITALAGYQAIYTHLTSMYGRKQGLFNDNILNFNIAPNDGQLLLGSDLETGQKSVFGKASYNYNDIFFADYTLRSDATSVFSPQHYWGVFPAVGTAWVISNHSFWAKNQKLADAISYLKLRGTWGSLGNASVGYFSFLRTLDQYNYSFNQQNVGAVFPTQGYDPDLQWEVTKTSDIGLDMNFLKSKMNFSFDWYHKETQGILMGLGAPLSYGLGSVPYENVGAMLNKGVEAQLSLRGGKGDFLWSLRGHFAYNKNKITKYAPLERTTLLSVGQEVVVGDEYGSMYGLQSAGIMQTQEEVDAAPKILGINPANYGPGDIKYVDQNNDGIIDYKDRIKLGVATAPIKYGVNMQGSWKQFNMSLFLEGSAGNKAYIGGALGTIGNGGNKASTYYWDRWTPENKTNEMPRAFYSYWQNNPNQVFSSFWLKSVSYLRVKSLSFSYNLPTSTCQKIGAKHLQIYYSGANLFTFSNFWKGLDPETSVPYASVMTFTTPTIHSVGLNIQF